MDEITLNRIASQLGAALVNIAILQGQLEQSQAKNATLEARLVELQEKLTPVQADHSGAVATRE